MPAPPPPPPPTFSAPSASGDGRGMLLQSIRAGKALKKTVTVDKSAPVISGKIRGESSSSVGSAAGGNSSSIASSISSNNGGPPNLGGLFSGGMPKLKATGLRSNIVEKDSSNSNSSSNLSNERPTPTAVSPAPSIKRGPPPVPPPATQKPQIFPQIQSVPDAPTNVAPEPPISKGFGKPMLAPKPPPPPLGAPAKPSPPPKKLNLLSGPSVSRAQSMRLPRSPPVLAPTPPSLHQSQDCLNETQHRPINRVLRPPIARPPSPPTSKTAPAPPITRAAPPPPSRLAVTAPSMPPPPPPPPNRSTSMHQRLAPPPPPTPPTRGASAASSVVRNGQSSATSMTSTTTSTMMAAAMTLNLDLEARFADKFHSIMNFPNPAQFRGFPKVYNSKNAAKQQAPAPPLQSTSTPSTMLQLNASSGGKQWQHNAASSAC